MLTVNIDLLDRFVNVQSRTIKYIGIDTKCNVTKMYIKFDDSKTGLKKINTDTFAKKHCWVPIEKTEIDVQMKPTKILSPVINRA